MTRGGLGLVLGLLLLLGVLVMLGLAAVWFVRQSRRGTVAAGTGADPLETARQRLAAGEITIPEFEEIRNQLRD